MNKLGGKLIGYGVKSKTGVERTIMFGNPIHNTITKHCLNNLLTFDGTDAVPSTNTGNNWLSLFVKSSGTSERYGVIDASALGDGTGVTSTDDTDLKHRITAFTQTKKTGNDWCGSFIDTDNASVKLRIAHVHTISSDCTVTEVGWYNRQYGTDNYTLSARAVLDSPISLESGDEFYTIYEILWSFQGVERFNDFAGLGPGYKTNAYFFESDYPTYNLPYPIPLIYSNGTSHNRFNADEFGSDNCATAFQPAWLNVGYGTRTVISNWDKWKPFMHASQPARNYMNNGSITYQPKHYVMDSFYRDVDITMDPSMIPSGNIYGFMINFTLYRFGTFDENDNFTPTPVTLSGTLRCTTRQKWSTDLLSPIA